MELSIHPTDTPEQIAAALLTLAKQAGSNPLKRETLKFLLLKELEIRGFDKATLALARKYFAPRTKRPRHQGGDFGIASTPAPIPTVSREEQWGDIQRLVHQLMYIKDEDALDFLMGVIAAHELDKDAPWSFLVGPPGSGKNEYLDLFRSHPKTLMISDLTARTLSSGLDSDKAAGHEAPSLLVKYPNAIYMFQDFTTFLSSHHEVKEKVFGQLRAIYDDTFESKFGTGEEIHWTGHISFLAGVTPVIYHQYKLLGALGQRFFIWRLALPPRKVMTQWARRRTDVRGLRKELQGKIAQFYRTLPPINPTIPDEWGEWLDNLVDFLSKARAPVKRDTFGNLEEAPEAEIGTRAMLQLMNLAKGVAQVNGHVITGEKEKRILYRVVWDSVPPIRAHTLRNLWKQKELDVPALQKGTTYSEEVIRTALEDLEALGVVRMVQKVTQHWTLTHESQEWLDHIEGSGT